MSDTQTLIDHEPEPDQAAQSRDRHLSDLADTIVHGINAELSCFRLIKDGDGYNDHIVLTDGARVLIRRLLKENL